MSETCHVLVVVIFECSCTDEAEKKGGFAAFDEEEATLSYFGILIIGKIVVRAFSILELHLLGFLPI